jgi:cell wall-associated NlpC family hydrolase
MTSSSAPASYRKRLALWNRAVARARLLLAHARLTRERRKRARLVAAARWGVAHQPGIHYAETRPIPLQRPGTLHGLPFTTDCSGFVTICFRAAAAPDPNSHNYDGQGFTGTLLVHGQKVRKPRRGDVVVYGPPPTGHHAALIVRGGRDPLTVSHGSEAGPLLIRVSQEQHYQPPGLAYRRFPVA